MKRLRPDKILEIERVRPSSSILIKDRLPRSLLSPLFFNCAPHVILDIGLKYMFILSVCCVCACVFE